MPGHDIIVVGASAGGVEALTRLARGLPPALPAAVFVVLHVPAHGTSALPRILDRSGPLPAAHARDGEAIEPGRIYVAPPDSHLLVKRGLVRLVHGSRENGHRPAIDPLFRTAARAYGPRVVGVVLSGTLDDGTAGLMVVKSRGGVAIVQDPGEALYEGMPRSAIENVAVDQVRPVSEIAPLLVSLAQEPAAEDETNWVSPEIEVESDMAEFDPAALASDPRPGTSSGFTCPECHGSLWELSDGELIRYRCRVGHAFSPDSLLAEQSQSLEAALWTAFRALRESAALARRMAAGARRRNHSLSADRFDEQAAAAEQRAALIRQVLLKGELFTIPASTPDRSVSSPPPDPGTAERTEAG